MGIPQLKFSLTPPLFRLFSIKNLSTYEGNTCAYELKVIGAG